jgi:hypothetical protein
MPKAKPSLENKWAKGFTEQQARGVIKTPDTAVSGFPLKYIWHTGPWYDICELQIAKLRRDILRAKAEDKLAIYLSCPISSREGTPFGQMALHERGHR